MFWNMLQKIIWGSSIFEVYISLSSANIIGITIFHTFWNIFIIYVNSKGYNPAIKKC